MNAAGTPRVALVGPVDDDQILSLAKALRERGEEPLLLDLDRLGDPLRLSWDGTRALADDLDLIGLHSLYLRSSGGLPAVPDEDFEQDPEEAHAALARRAAASRERAALVRGLLDCLEAAGVRVVNPASCLSQHRHKPSQLLRLLRAGLPIPPTLASNDPDAVVAFAAKHEEVVYKPLAGGALCRSVRAADLSPARLALLATAPVLFQRRIRGRTLRAFVVGERVPAVYEVVSSALDYRGSEEEVRELARKDPLRDAAAQLALAAARATGMVFSGVDLMGPDLQSLVVLEANPSPMFEGFQRWCARAGGGAPVSAAFAELLLRPSG